MTELKLVKTLLISLILYGVLIIPRVLSWILGVMGSIVKVLKSTIDTFTKSLKEEVIN